MDFEDYRQGPQINQRSRGIQKRNYDDEFGVSYENNTPIDQRITYNKPRLIGKRRTAAQQGKTLRLNPQSASTKVRRTSQRSISERPDGPIITAQDEALKLGILPVTDPTANPFILQKDVKLPKNKVDLKKLQVKVDLSKIGEAPRAYQQILIAAEDKENLIVASTSAPLGERFAKVENALPALHPQTIKLMNNQRGITGKAATKLPIKIQPVKISNKQNGDNTRDSLKMTKEKKL